MSLSSGLATVKSAVEIYLADPVQGGPGVPPGPTQARVNSVWGWGLWVFAACAALAALVALAVAIWQHQSGRPNDGFGRLGVIIGACVAASSIAGAIGVLTGT